MQLPLTISNVGAYTVVEFTTPSLMDPLDLERIGDALCEFIDTKDKSQLVLDFERVQYLSSQAIGVILTLNKKLSEIPKSKLIICGVGPRLQELLKITRLDKILTIKPTQQEAIRS